MQLGRPPVNCSSCAERKVRCDRQQPCGHCKRRKGVCVYRANDPNVHPRNNTQRVERLKDYIRRLGGDPQLIEQSLESGETNIEGSSTYGPTPEARSVVATASPGRSKDMKGMEGPIAQKSGLVEHDEQVTYIEAPMWYSWSGVKKPGEQPQASSPEQANKANTKSKALHSFSALLDPTFTPDGVSLHSIYPPARETIALWKQYLKNVHPLVMIFFDWEIEVIIHKAAHNPTGLTREEQALVLAIYFIATLSLSEEECLDMLHDKRSHLLDKFQKAVEDSLLIAELAVTSDRLVLQAFILYLLAMRNRARPAALFSLIGIASRIAERMGIHRDGTSLSLPPFRSEERRRVWWQLQNMEIMTAQLTGSIAMTIYADWDAALPQNLEDQDLRPDMQALPPERHGLTTISFCLWRYQILYMQRRMRQPDGSRVKGISWMLSPQVSLAEKDAQIDTVEKELGSQFLQHCEPLNPLHVHMQIGVRSLVLAARIVARQPALMNAKISEMSTGERDDFLGLCTKSLEYYVLSQKTEMLRGFGWNNENYFQWPAFVYTILEAHHRSSSAEEDATITDLWSLISRVYAVHDTLTTAIQNPDVASIVRITLAAYQKRHAYILEQYRHRCNNHNNTTRSNAINVSESESEPEHKPQPPEWIQDLCQKFNLLLSDAVNSSTLEHASDTTATTATGNEPAFEGASEGLLPADFDFDMIDWSFWENVGLDSVV